MQSKGQIQGYEWQFKELIRLPSVNPQEPIQGVTDVIQRGVYKMIEVEIIKPSQELQAAIIKYYPSCFFYYNTDDELILSCSTYTQEPSGNSCLILNTGYIKVQLYIPDGSYSIIRKVKL